MLALCWIFGETRSAKEHLSEENKSIFKQDSQAHKWVIAAKLGAHCLKGSIPDLSHICFNPPKNSVLGISTGNLRNTQKPLNFHRF